MKPFLKWAGNKYQIIERIKDVLPQGKRLIEPFVGSGAIFLNTDYPQYLLTDSNPDLITLYQNLQSDGESLIDECREFFNPANNAKQIFYELRTLFNTTDNQRLKSLLFVYLNKHSFNGLCRYNAKGKFNAPFGEHKNPYFPEKEMLAFYQQAQRATFHCIDFLATMHTAEPGDIVYCDPPYVPLSKTANFTSYSAGGFDETQQLLLAKTAKDLAAKNIPVVISNHDTKFTQKIYQQAKIIKFDVQRLISRDGKNRNKAPEMLAIFN